MKQLTELDYCVLGVIWRHGPLSAYRVRCIFAESTTPVWSSSAGSIYPSIKRLTAAELVEAAVAQDKRGTRLLRIRKAGLDSLRHWLVEFPPSYGSATADPLRTRAQFLVALPSAEQSRFLERAEVSTRAALAELEGHSRSEAENPSAKLDLIGTMGAVFELQARLKWLELTRTLAAEMNGRAPE